MEWDCHCSTLNYFLDPSVQFIALWPCDVIWWQRSGSVLPQVMAWCRQAPSHYLNQYWLIIYGFCGIHKGTSSQEIHVLMILICKRSLWNYIFEIAAAFIWSNWTSNQNFHYDQFHHYSKYTTNRVNMTTYTAFWSRLFFTVSIICMYMYLYT